MDENELARTVGEAVGQALGEMSVGTGMVVLALTNAITKQGNIDKHRLFQDMLAALPEVDGAANNVIEVVRHALVAALADLNDAT